MKSRNLKLISLFISSSLFLGPKLLLVSKKLFPIVPFKMPEPDVRLDRVAGGSIINHKPLFSLNSKNLYIGFGSLLRIFNTENGEHIQDIDVLASNESNSKGNIVAICNNPRNGNTIICFEDTYLVGWSFETNQVTHAVEIERCVDKIVDMKLVLTNADTSSFDVIIATGMKRNKIKLHVVSYETGEIKFTSHKSFDSILHGWSVSSFDDKRYMAGIYKNSLTVINLLTKKQNRDITVGSDRYYTCVACHPVEECIAVGDNTGRIILYYDFLRDNNKSPFHIYHWHSLPVNDVVFSNTGSIFYSGGNENVLVKWTTHAPDVRHFLPRLPAPLLHLTPSQDNQLIAVSTVDNGILIIDAQQRIQCSLQQFTWGFVNVPGQRLFPAGLSFDPRSNCIVMNGRPGHVQFFMPHYSTLIYNVDVAGENYLSQERHQTIVNSEVIAVDFSGDGMWMATSHTRSDPNFSDNTYLKFWSFVQKSQTYKLESSVTLHNAVTKISFQPLEGNSDDINLDYLAVTVCADKKFRVWLCKSIPKKRNHNEGGWNCDSIGYYRDHALSDIAFSSDGSLLGAAFGPSFTLWDVQTNTMKTSLTKGHSNLKRVEFGNGNCSSIAVSVNETTIYAWDLLSLTVSWSVELEVSLLVSNKLSEYMAIFTTSNDLVVFNISSSVPVYTREKVTDSFVVSCIFYPDGREDKECSQNGWLRNSSLYFLTASQDLMVLMLSTKAKDSDNLVEISGKYPITPFKALIANKSVSDVTQPVSSNFLQLGSSWQQTVTQLLSFPANSLPPMRFICKSILQSSLISRPNEDSRIIST